MFEEDEQAVFPVHLSKGQPCMTKEELQRRLIENHKKLTGYVTSLSDEDFSFSPNSEKWSAGQQLDHIHSSVYPLKFILGFPKWFLKFVLKRANRPSKTYEALISKYHLKLKGGGKASGRFLAGKVETGQKISLGDKINTAVLKLCNSLNKFSEADLDKFVIPHPLLGKLTIREMMYFTIYHAEHHQNIIINLLQGRQRLQ